MNSIKKYGFELLIAAAFIIINISIVFYFNGEIKAEQSRAEFNNIQAEVSDGYGKKDDSEGLESESKNETENETGKEEALISSGENNSETKTQAEDEATPKPEKKNKKSDKNYDKIVNCYKILMTKKLSEDEVLDLIYDLDKSIPRNYKFRKDGEKPRSMARIMINEIFARHGYTFNNDSLQEFYNKKDWYKKLKKITVSDQLKRQENILNIIKKKNKKLRKYYDYLAKIA